MVFGAVRSGGRMCLRDFSFPPLACVCTSRRKHEAPNTKLGDGAPVGREQSKEHRESI